MSDAIAVRDALKEEIENPPIESPLDGVRTVADYAEHWWTQKAPTLTPNTKRTYELALGEYVLPFLGEIYIERLTRSDVVQWVGELDKLKKPDGKPYARSTRRGWWRVGKQLLLDLKAEFGLLHNPVERVRPPKVGGGKSRTRRTLTAEQLREYVETFESLIPSRYPEVLVLATTGMRAGELYGLVWSDINYEAGVIEINRASAEGELLAKTKTGGVRTVPMAPKVAKVLKDHHKQLMADAHPGLQDNLVFPSDVGTCRSSASLFKPMGKISSRLGLDFRVTPQVLRRSFNTINVTGGADQIVLRSVMGHNSPEMTELYAGVEMTEKRQALKDTMGFFFDD